MSELEGLIETFGETGGDRAVFSDSHVAHVAVSGHTILSMREVEGFEVEAEETATGIDARVRVSEEVVIERPVHLCFGVLRARGVQEIKIAVKLERNSSAHFIAHCMFPKAEKVRHVMDAVVDIAEGARYRYSEAHYHGLQGGVEVVPRAIVRVGKDGRYFSDFTLSTGRVGRLDMDYSVEAGESAVTELLVRVFGHATDEIRIKEKVALNGRNSRGLIKTRIALEDEASAEVTGITEGNAEGARGHVDCMEIVKDNAVARAVPIVNVTNPLAKVTHEAAIGSIDRRQLETLMAHGLTPQEAVDVIVRGILA